MYYDDLPLLSLYSFGTTLTVGQQMMFHKLSLENMLGTNYVPDHDERIKIQRIIPEKQRELDSITAELSGARIHLDDLREKHHKATETADIHAIPSTPVRRVPHWKRYMQVSTGRPRWSILITSHDINYHLKGCVPFILC